MAESRTVSAREFNRGFKKLRGSLLRVEAGGKLLGTWIPAPQEPRRIDLLARLRGDHSAKLPFTGAQLLKESKKR